MFDVNGLLEEARYFVGCHLMKSEKYEEAIDNFKSLNTAQAAFNQALVLHISCLIFRLILLSPKKNY